MTTAHVLRHPYDPGTRVCHAKENTEATRTTGTAEVIESSTQTDGSYDYLVHTDAGSDESWPSYFTVPVAAPMHRHHGGSSATAAPATGA